MQESQAHAAASRSKDAQPTILISANSCWNIVNFRAGLIRALRDRKYRIVIVASDDEYRSQLADLGAAFVPVPINSSGISVVEDLRLAARYVQVFRQLRPFAFLGFTAKPNIYGSLAAPAVGAKVINNISGSASIFFIIGIILIALMVGLRYEVGADRPTYKILFSYAAYADLGRMLSLGDPAFQMLNWTVRQMGAEIWLVNLVGAAIFSWGLLRFTQAQPSPWLAVLVAIPYLVTVVAMGYTR